MNFVALILEKLAERGTYALLVIDYENATVHGTFL
jgi:hypothetical protein